MPKDLLVSAKNGDGYILYAQFIGGASLQAAIRNFINPKNSHREEARWKAALDELLERQLIESVGDKGETFRLTKLGYEIADGIEAAIGGSFKPNACIQRTAETPDSR